MKGKIAKTLLMVAGAAVTLTGCIAVENQFLVKLPFFEAKSDHIPGLDSPHERAKILHEKGEKGEKADEQTKEILVAQLMYEYQTSPDPNMRRQAVDSLAIIPYKDRDRYLQEILQDENPFVRISALEALGKSYSGNLEDLTTLLIDRIKIDADKDVRLTAVKILGNVLAKNNRVIQQEPYLDVLRNDTIVVLGDLLKDKTTAVRYEAMQSLQKITDYDCGNDINRWLEYVRYTKGEVPNLPPKRTLMEKMPSITLPMFK